MIYNLTPCLRCQGKLLCSHQRHLSPVLVSKKKLILINLYLVNKYYLHGPGVGKIARLIFYSKENKFFKFIHFSMVTGGKV